MSGLLGVRFFICPEKFSLILKRFSTASSNSKWNNLLTERRSKYLHHQHLLKRESETTMIGQPKTKQELLAALQRESAIKVETTLEGSPREVAAKIETLKAATIQVIVLKT